MTLMQDYLINTYMPMFRGCDLNAGVWSEKNSLPLVARALQGDRLAHHLSNAMAYYASELIEQHPDKAFPCWRCDAHLDRTTLGAMFTVWPDLMEEDAVITTVGICKSCLADVRDRNAWIASFFDELVREHKRYGSEFSLKILKGDTGP